MRTLKQITDAVRRSEDVNYDELRYAVVAYDVMLAKMNISADREQVREFFIAIEADPCQYVGWDNDPKNPDVVQWHRERGQMPDIIQAAREILESEEGAKVGSDINGIECPHCGVWNAHDECGTYDVWLPACKSCGKCTEVPPIRSERTPPS